MSKAIALIPARGGSKRIPHKNIRVLAGHPLLAYTICAALDSGVFEKVLVSSDDTETLDIAARYGADCLRRPDDLATDTSPDIGWVRHALEASQRFVKVSSPGLGSFDAPVFRTFSILRPTSPFRKPETIQRAMAEWEQVKSGYTSLRAVEKCSQHPGKMYQLIDHWMFPVLTQPLGQPYHDSQYAALPPVFVQNASLEIAHVETVLTTGTISGSGFGPARMYAFLTEGDEGLDVNTERDWALAEYLIDRGDATLPAVRERAHA